MPVQTYTVKGGDNLFSIAGSVYGNQRMFAEIMRLNGLTSGVIRPGMVLKLPQPKPDYAINVSGGLMNAVKAENDFVQQNKRMPTQQELQDFQAQQQTPTIGGTTGIPQGMTQEQYLQRFRTASGTGTGMKFTTPGQPKTTATGPYVSPQEPKTSIYEPKQYTEQTRGQVLAKTVPQALIGAAKSFIEPQIRFMLQNPADIAAGAASYLLNPTLGIPTYTTARSMVVGAQNYLNAPVTQARPQPAIQYNQQQQQQPQTPTNQYQQGGTVYNPLQKTVFDTTTPNLPKTNLQEQQLPRTDAGTPSQEQLLQIGMTPDQANLYIKAFDQGLTQSEADQFRYVFNVKPGSQLDMDLYGVTAGSTGPSTNEELTSNIWQELQNLGQYGTMPTEWIIAGPRQGGGGGGGGSGGGGGGGQNYSSGGSMTWGGF